MSQEERLNRKQEECLRRELHEAREALQRAQLDHESACKAGGTLDAGNPDGLYAFQKASKHYGAALERYSEALRDLSASLEALRAGEVDSVPLLRESPSTYMG
jgi:hypothetical protein